MPRVFLFFVEKNLLKDRILTIDQKLNNPNHNTFRTLFVVRFISDAEIVTNNARGRNETRNAIVSERESDSDSEKIESLERIES